MSGILRGFAHQKKLLIYGLETYVAYMIDRLFSTLM